MREFKGRSILDFPDSYVVIDIETTGLDPSRDYIIEVAALKIINGIVKETFSSLINPGVQINQYITNLTGITNQDLSEAPDPACILPNFYNFIGDAIIVGHNVHFDINFLYDNFEKYLSKPLCNNFVDTLRLSKKYFKSVPSHKLTVLSKFLNIPVEVSHRALADCYTANSLYKKIVEVSNDMADTEQILLDSLSFNNTNPFYKKRIVVKGIPQLYSFVFMKEVSKKCGAKMNDIFYSNCDYIIFSRHTYKKYQRGETSLKIEKANRLANTGSLKILSEEEWCQMLELPVPQILATSAYSFAKNITTEKTDFDETHPLFGKLCVFTGTLEKMSRKEAMQIVVDFGGQVGNSVTKKTNYLILGNNDYCPLIKDGKSSKQKKAESLKLSGNDIEIISENVFYDMIVED